MPLRIRHVSCAVIALFVAAPAFAESVPAESALAISVQDSQVQWGPCPPFMPAGCGLAVLHGDPAKPNSDVFLKVPAGETIPHHWHTSAERMILVSGQMEVTYDGQEPVTLTPGMYAFGPAKLGHVASCNGAESCVLFIAFEAPVDAIPTVE